MIGSLSTASLLRIQAALLAIVFLVSAFYPRSGQAALLIPLGPSGAHDAFGWALQHDAPVLNAGPWQGTYVLRASSDSLALEALVAHTLLIAVPSSFCGAAPASKDF